jgi:hypothetical protein
VCHSLKYFEQDPLVFLVDRSWRQRMQGHAQLEGEGGVVVRSGFHLSVPARLSPEARQEQVPPGFVFHGLEPAGSSSTLQQAEGGIRRCCAIDLWQVHFGQAKRAAWWRTSGFLPWRRPELSSSQIVTSARPSPSTAYTYSRATPGPGWTDLTPPATNGYLHDGPISDDADRRLANALESATAAHQRRHRKTFCVSVLGVGTSS